MTTEKFKVGDKVKVRLAGGVLISGEIVIKSSTKQFFPGSHAAEILEYGVRFDKTSKIGYYKEGDLIIEGPAWTSKCSCGSEAAHAPRPAPGHASYCNLWSKK